MVEHGDDQEDRVRAGRRRLIELVGVEDEVLTQHRQLRGRDRVTQVLERAAEVHALGDDRQRRRAAALIGLDDLLHRRALADDPGRRRAPLVLGDHGQAGARERFAERPALRPLVERRLQLVQRRGPAPALELLPRRLDDPLENVQDGANCCVSATSVSSASAAAPESSACSAARTPALDAVDPPRDVDRGAGVQGGQVARGAFLAGEHPARHLGVVLRRAAGDGLERNSGQADVLRSELVGVDSVPSTSTTVVVPAVLISSSPSALDTTSALSAPRRASAPAMVRRNAGPRRR